MKPNSALSSLPKPNRLGLLTVAGLSLVALAVFLPLVGTHAVLFSTDDNIGLIASGKQSIPQGFFGRWEAAGLLGSPAGVLSVSWMNALLWATSPRWFTNWIHALNLVLAGGLLGVFLRRNGAGWAACMTGALSALWIGSNFTLVYAGHTPKFGVLMFAAASLCAIANAVEGPRRIRWSVLAGGAIGLMLLEQQDLALFFGLFLGAYMLLRLWRASGIAWPQRFLHVLAPLGVTALLLAGPTLLGSYFANVKGVSSVSAENPEAKWEFCTQWSVPPDETIDLIAPGYTGWRSGEPEGPYWGHTGQSAGWDQTHQGFMNFRLESIYIGAIPVVLALFAVAAALWGGRGGGWKVDGGGMKPAGIQSPLNSDLQFQASTFHLPPSTILSDRRAEILFWGAAALVALLLAYGKYFPLYALFYQLPVVNNIRNPNKFLQVFQLALGICAAHGVSVALNGAVKHRRTAHGGVGEETR